MIRVIRFNEKPHACLHLQLVLESRASKNRVCQKMDSPVLRTSDDLFEYQFITNETLEDALHIMRTEFFVHENVCAALELSKSPEAVKEIETLCVRTAKDGVSIIVIEKKTGTVVGAAFNKLQVKDSDEANFFEEYASNCKHPSSKEVMQYMINADATVDLFKMCEVDCILEIMFIAVLPECKGRGIGSKMCELSIEIAETLLRGDNVKVSMNKDEVLPIEPVPQAVSAIFTSNITHKIMKRLNFSIATELSYEKYVFEGRTLASRIGPNTTSSVVVYKKLVRK